jgi:hypothetical protein
MASKIIENPS